MTVAIETLAECADASRHAPRGVSEGNSGGRRVPLEEDVAGNGHRDALFLTTHNRRAPRHSIGVALVVCSCGFFYLVCTAKIWATGGLQSRSGAVGALRRESPAYAFQSAGFVETGQGRGHRQTADPSLTRIASPNGESGREKKASAPHRFERVSRPRDDRQTQPRRGGRSSRGCSRRISRGRARLRAPSRARPFVPSRSIIAPRSSTGRSTAASDARRRRAVETTSRARTGRRRPGGDLASSLASTRGASRP